MPYLIYKTNGKVLTTVNDSDVDISTSLNLVGKNYAGYGLAVNENFIYLLENFASTSAPAKPIIGQTWFDSTPTQNKLKVYDGASFEEFIEASSYAAFRQGCGFDPQVVVEDGGEDEQGVCGA